MNITGAKADSISRAAIHWFREMGHVSDAEMLQRILPAKAKASLKKADKEMNLGWNICREWMSDREIAEVRHLSHCTYAKRMGWYTSKNIYIFDRVYIIS
jgi:hypothetical protein